MGLQIRETATEVLCPLELPVLAALLPELLATLHDPVACDGAMLALSKLPPAMLSDHIGTLLRTLLYQFEMCFPERGTGLLILARMEPAELAAHTDEFQEALLHTDERVRRTALKVLKLFPLASIAAYAATLRDFLADPDSLDVQELAAELLARLQQPALADGLDTLHTQPVGRARLLQVLGELPASTAPPPAAVRIKQKEGHSSPASKITALGGLTCGHRRRTCCWSMRLATATPMCRASRCRCLRPYRQRRSFNTGPCC
jgi:hypothetical protein